jgi:pSer/pThr/pTyr-binding forkhead associated (FHA) protein
VSESDFLISDILQSYAQLGLAGRLVVQHQGREGQLFLQEGNITHAQIGNIHGEAAAFIVLKWEKCFCRWMEKDTPAQNTLYYSVENLLLKFSDLTDLSEKDLIEKFSNKLSIITSQFPPLSVVISSQGIEPFRFDLELSTIIVGRSAEYCHIVIPDETVSSQHGMFTTIGRKIHYKDMGSTNGTWMHGKLLSEVEIQLGQTLMLGKVKAQICDFSQTDKARKMRETTNLDDYLQVHAKQDELVASNHVDKKVRTTVKLDISKWNSDVDSDKNEHNNS